MKILFFGHLKDITGCGETAIACDDTDANGVWHALVQVYPGLHRCRNSVRLARNSEYTGPEARFQDTDEVALIPPVSGG